jgi:hypothetical protein
MEGQSGSVCPRRRGFEPFQRWWWSREVEERKDMIFGIVENGGGIRDGKGGLSGDIARGDWMLGPGSGGCLRNANCHRCNLNVDRCY